MNGLKGAVGAVPRFSGSKTKQAREIGVKGRGVGSFLRCVGIPLGHELESVVTRGRLGPALGYFWTLFLRKECMRASRWCKRHELHSFEFDATEKSRKQETSGRWRRWAHGSMQHSRTLPPRTYSLCHGSCFILSGDEKIKREWPADLPSYCRLAASIKRVGCLRWHDGVCVC